MGRLAGHSLIPSPDLESTIQRDSVGNAVLDNWSMIGRAVAFGRVRLDAMLVAAMTFGGAFVAQLGGAFGRAIFLTGGRFAVAMHVMALHLGDLTLKPHQ